MSVESDTAIDNETLYAQQLAELGSAALGPHEQIAVWHGFPPGDRCIATPECLKEQVETGQFPTEETPLSQLATRFEEQFGPAHVLRLGQDFDGAASQPNAEPSAPQNNFLFDLTRG